MPTDSLPLIFAPDPGAGMAWWRNRRIDRATFLMHVARTGQHLPDRGHVFNLCQDRYLFLVAFAAVIARGQTNLLPANRASQELNTVAAAYPDHYRLQDQDILRHLETGAPGSPVPAIAAEHLAAVAFTSGSTGQPRPNLKRWGELTAGARLSRQRFGFDPQHYPDAYPTLVATVPAQHMYGLETSVLLPLLSGVAVYGGRPFFPEDIRVALAAVPPPRVLVTTPAHLRICVETELTWPALDFIISATAPLAPVLAERAERIFAAHVFEIYGCTEAGSLASRRTVAGDVWRFFDGFRLDSDSGCVLGAHLPEPVLLNDLIEPVDDMHFKLLGRRGDLINIAGKRASLADLNHKLNDIAGVEDGVFVLPAEPSVVNQRLTALVVAPALSERHILNELAERIDSAFMPRPLYKVARLPRNDTGKLPHNELLALLRQLKK